MPCCVSFLVQGLLEGRLVADTCSFSVLHVWDPDRTHNNSYLFCSTEQKNFAKIYSTYISEYNNLPQAFLYIGKMLWVGSICPLIPSYLLFSFPGFYLQTVGWEPSPHTRNIIVTLLLLNPTRFWWKRDMFRSTVCCPKRVFSLPCHQPLFQQQTEMLPGKGFLIGKILSWQKTLLNTKNTVPSDLHMTCLPWRGYE